MSHFEQHAGTDDAAIDSLAVRVSAFERDLDAVLGLYRQATDDLREAEQRYQRIRGLGTAAAEDYAEADREYQAAARSWRLVTLAILSAASWDYAGHLCATRMTTGQYRRELREQGVDLEGLDADHGLPKSLGGADHPLNFEMIDSSLNRSLGNDVMRKLMAHPLHCCKARRCPRSCVCDARRSCDCSSRAAGPAAWTPSRRIQEDIGCRGARRRSTPSPTRQCAACHVRDRCKRDAGLVVSSGRRESATISQFPPVHRRSR